MQNSMSQHKDQIDQDALAAEWGLALEAEAATAARGGAAGRCGAGTDEAAAQWAAMVDEDNDSSAGRQGRRRAHPQSG